MRQQPSDGPWRRYVALGDSFTEGMVDAVGAGADPGDDSGVAPAPAAPASDTTTQYRGWADLLALGLDGRQQRAARAREQDAPPLEYANLAVRGRLQRQVLDEQLPAALAMEPDLVSLSAGGNDLIRPGADVAAIAARTDAATARLRAAGADVLLVAGFDPALAPVLRMTRGRVADHNQRLWATAVRHGARVVDLWSFAPLQDARVWGEDRLHLATPGHERVARLALATLLDELPDEADPGSLPSWAQPLPPEPTGRGAAAAARADARWARHHLAPWVGRRLTGRSSGDGRGPKRPVPTPVERTRNAQ